MAYSISTFYRFVPLPSWRELQAPLRAAASAQGLRGTVLLAEEGLNGTLAGTPDGLQAFFRHLHQVPGLEGLQGQLSEADYLPFDRLKVRLKSEIVSLRVPVDPARRVGAYVPPAAWNRLISDPETVLIDTRNRPEVAIGTFRGAIDPQTTAFSDFPAFVRSADLPRDRPIALFCTGGIRCEKATSYLLDQGFQRVYHLQGGILNYLRTIPPAESRWEGQCFVFDQRFAVDHALRPRYADPVAGRAHLGEGWAKTEA